MKNSFLIVQIESAEKEIVEQIKGRLSRKVTSWCVCGPHLFFLCGQPSGMPHGLLCCWQCWAASPVWYWAWAPSLTAPRTRGFVQAASPCSCQVTHTLNCWVTLWFCRLVLHLILSLMVPLWGRVITQSLCTYSLFSLLWTLLGLFRSRSVFNQDNCC